LALFFPINTATRGAIWILYPLLWNHVLLNILFYPSDIPSILFFTLGLRFLVERRWAVYYPLFILATFNKETTCFLTVAMIALYWDHDRPARLALHVAAQAIVWIAIKLLLGHLFAANSGEGTFEHHMRVNLSFLASFMLRPTTWNWRRVLIFGGAWALVPLEWSQLPQAMRRLAWVAAPFAVGMFCVGVLSEVRVFGELDPIILAPAMYGLWIRRRSHI